MIAFYNSIEYGYNICPGGGSVMKGRKHSEEAKQKISEAIKGRKHSEEAKQKISEATKGSNNPMYGKTYSEETLQKMSDAKRGEKHPRSKLTDIQ